MKLFFKSGQYPGRILNVKPDGMTIGRGPENDLTLHADGISRNHCRLFQRGEDWYVEDLGSTNGVVVNGEKIAAPTRLRKDDKIELYDQVLVFTDDQGAAAFKTGGAPATGAAAHATAGSTTTEPHPHTETPKKQQPEPTPENTIPWGHIILLVVLVAVVGWALYSTLISAPEKQPRDAETTQNENAADTENDVPPPDQQDTTTPGAEADAGETTTGETDTETGVAPEVVEPDDDGDAEDDAATDVGPDVETRVVAKTAPETKVEEEEKRFTVVINSDPEGAMLTLDGQDIGRTPAVVKKLSGGRHTLQLERNGFEQLRQLVFVPDTLQEKPYKLRLKPGVVRVTSTPRGATVFHGTQVLGQTPVVIKNLPRGDNTLRLAAYGYKSQTVTAEVNDLKGTELHLQLDSTLGGVEVLTLPAGCRVLVDDTYKGTTEQAPDIARNQSKPLPVKGLRAGPHKIKVEHPNGASDSKKVEIKAGAASTVAFRLWVMDTKLTLKDGTVIYGMLVSRNEFGDIIMSVYPTRKMTTFLKDQIQEVDKLKPREAREIMEKKQGKESARAHGDDDDREPKMGGTPRFGPSAAA